MNEELLNGGYQGLYGEVVEADLYRIRQLDFVPDIIFDVGANIGIFTRFARTLFPQALIVAVEPDPENMAVLEDKTDDDPNLILVPMALGSGTLYRGLTHCNGSGATYISTGCLGYPAEVLLEVAGGEKPPIEPSTIRTVTLARLVEKFLQPGMLSMLKLDCEGAENSIWWDESSMEALRKMDYIAAEIHFYAVNSEEAKTVRLETLEALKTLGTTHTCELDGVHFWARKNNI